MIDGTYVPHQIHQQKGCKRQFLLPQPLVQDRVRLVGNLNIQNITFFRKLDKEGGWKCYSKCLKENCFINLLSMQCINRGHLAAVV